MSTYPREEPPAAYVTGSDYSNEKGYGEKAPHFTDEHGIGVDADEPRALHRDLKSRHLQMIAIGGAIGAGLFVGSGSALNEGGPASLVICYLIIGIMMVFVMQALAELGVMYPVNGAFFEYTMRFVEPCWGFAIGWDYAFQWLTILPFEITAAGITLSFWKAARDINIGAWVTIFLFCLIVIQYFGIRGYGEVEFVLSIIKITACLGFILFSIILNCGGIPGGPGYIGAKYWYHPGAFRNGFKGFCGVFVNAAFAFGGTELTGLAAAEAANPIKSIPVASKQVVWRVLIFYVVSLLMIGLNVPSDSKYLLNASGANTKDSPFVLSIKQAGVPVLPSIFNGVITISVLSVANSCTFGSTRTLQALAAHKMAPKFLGYVDKAGRPLYCVLIQIAFGFLAFIQEAPGASDSFFDWLLALSGVADFFVWGTICLCHIRFRSAWKYHGHSLDEIPYRAQYGVLGSWIGLGLNILCIMASFYTAVASLSVKSWFEDWLAGPLILALYLFWKLFTQQWRLYTPLAEIDVMYGIRHNLDELRNMAEEERAAKTSGNLWKRILHNLF